MFVCRGYALLVAAETIFAIRTFADLFIYKEFRCEVKCVEDV